MTKMLSLKKRKPKTPPQTHVDGPTIPSALLGELRASYKRYQAALKAVDDHNEQAKFIQREAINAEAVHLHFVGRVQLKFGATDGDLLDLDRGVLRIQVKETN
jgi:hypothetical protein